MKRIQLTIFVAALYAVAACKKQATDNPEGGPLPIPTNATAAAAPACAPVIFNLAVDPATGFSYLYKVVGSPSAGPISVTPINGSMATNQLRLCGGTPVKFASGLSFDPASNTWWGTTGAAGTPANHILKFTDPNCITAIPALNTCGLLLDLSDIERDPTSGLYYALNRGTASPNNRVVRIGIPGANVICLPNPLSPSLFVRGLTVHVNGKLYVMAVNGTSGRLLDVNKVSGLVTATYSYPGAITPSPGVNIPEMGLHHDSICVNRFITGNYDPIALPPLYTDGIPAGLPGGPVYSAVSGALKPTVDWARP
ncbi:hypothetical protein [Paraflavitalea pollutisoli]|uniref:hypothetical protein n=1 Tax=Paraflavitalea pollutisoli TaxID=3034143 RepID=UPI0023ED3020|nr:hypothetical protein [Paraflavitalea sp. H1-2-19X]